MSDAVAEAGSADDRLETGQVCLMKSGAFFKIGRSNAAGRRAYELAIQTPEKLEVVHVIGTDDAVGGTTLRPLTGPC